eukprot:TRINITY_DN2341_c0_g1_i1.p1 TRINITY_DN2341_c0_g1~~TRINITY_DN2341_c0_g1_i1.p1  ORF type:complete len:168 (-),score=37.05 TRINITY_DN2341_c0_g1_i1:22-525(-)
MLVLGYQILDMIAVGNDQQKDYFYNLTNESHWNLRVLSYPPMSDIPEGYGISVGEHTDYGFLTMVNQDLNPTAIQVKNENNEWIDGPPIDGAFLMNIGDMLSYWTNGEYRSTPHRVIHTNSKKPRISVPFFFEPNYDAVIKGLGKDNGVMYGDHLCSKVFNNFDFDK